MTTLITPLPTPPTRQDSVNFNDRADDFLGSLPLFQQETNAVAVEVQNSAYEVEVAKTAIASIANITKWISGLTYDEGSSVWSPINGTTYRKITNSVGGSIDPSLDTINYRSVSDAAGITYTLPEPNSVLSTVQDKLKEYVSVKDFGAIGDGLADDTSAFLSAISSGFSIFVPEGTYNLSQKLTSTGQVAFKGAGKTRTYLKWQNNIGQQGFSITPSSWYHTIDISDMSLLTEGSATDTAIYINWKPLGTSGIPYFDRRAYLSMLLISGTSRSSNGWKKGIECDFPFAVQISDCEIWGKSSSSALLSTDFVPGSIGISVPDQSIRTLANFTIKNTTIIGFLTATLIYNVEGINHEWCDYQVCYDGLDIRNTISKTNQHRISHNHIGVSGTTIRVRSCRQVLIESNELSYRYGRTDGGSVSIIEMDSVYACVVVGNSIRGNVFNDTNVIVDGVSLKWDYASGVDFTRKISITGNNFQALRYAIRNDAGTNSRDVNIIGNTYDIIRQKVMEYGSGSALLVETQRLGAGNFELGSVPTTNTVLQLVNLDASLISLDRQSGDGGAMVMRRDGNVVGTVSVSTTGTTYSTTSDERLKSDLGYLSPSAAKEIIKKIKIHVFKWLSNPDGVEDVGVFAQELYKIYPKAVIVGKANPGDKEFEPWSVDYSKLVPILIAAMSE